jgi:hypothetical protein
MAKFTVTALLLTALAAPVLLFWQLGSRSSLSGLPAAAIAIAAGWMLGVIWAYASQAAPPTAGSQVNGGNLRIAAAFGWVCPVVLVFLTWLVLRFFASNAA